MGSWEDIEQEENTGSSEVSSVMEEVYSGTWHIGEERRFRKYKRSCGWVWRKNKCRSKMTREVKYGRKRYFRKGKLPGKYIAKMLYE